MGYLPDMPRANVAPFTTAEMAGSRFPKGGLRLIMSGQPHEEREGHKPRKDGVVVQGGMLINLSKTYRGERDADLRVDGRAATRRRRQMEKRA